MAEVTHQSFSGDCRSFLSGDATVTIAHRCTPKGQLKELACLADIIVAAAGNLHLPDQKDLEDVIFLLEAFKHVATCEYLYTNVNKWCPRADKPQLSLLTSASQ